MKQQKPEILFVNCCVRGEQSRTQELCSRLLAKLDGQITEIDLNRKGIKPLDSDTLVYRDNLVASRRWENPLFSNARQFAQADLIVIGAPYWDLSFPAVLKAYIESICVSGITFRYTETGEPQGLCQASKLYYVTTAGGFIGERNFGYDYLRALCWLFGITDTACIKAEGLDIAGADIRKILDNTLIQI